MKRIVVGAAIAADHGVDSDIRTVSIRYDTGDFMGRSPSAL
jgi:hypothetical protein